MLKYIVSSGTYARAAAIAQELDVKKDEFIHVGFIDYHTGIRSRLYGLGIDHPSQLIGYFSENERKMLLRRDKIVEYFDFSKALKLLKMGKKIARKNWGGYWFLSDTGKVFVPDKNELLPFNQMIVARLKDGGGFIPAQPYQEDMLAEDWYEVE